MGKKLDITPEIAARLQKAYGGEVDTSKYTVYEAIIANTVPLRRRTGLYAKAVMSTALMYDIAKFLQQETIPLQGMHDTSSLPDGKVFWAEVRTNNLGQPEVFAQFYISNTEDKIIAKVEDATIDEVSMGILSQHVNCSVCGFDYRGPDATWENRWDLTCNNDHTIGVNGVHVILNGLESLDELSLVNKGAVNGAKIVAQDNKGTKATFRLAASATGKADDPFHLHLSCETTTEAPEMSGTTPQTPAPGASVAEIVTLANDAATSKAALTVAQGEVTTLKASVTDLTAQLAAANEALTKFRERESNFAAHESMKKSHDAMLDFLTANFKSVSAALGNLNPEVPTDPDKLMAGLKEAAPNLASIYHPGGRSMNHGGGANPNNTPAVASAFRTPR